MIKNLISTTDFVVQMSKLTGNDISDEKRIEVVINHAKFMKRDLEVGMFIPCDEEGRVLEKIDEKYDFDTLDFGFKVEEYKRAEERVLFEGWKLIDYVWVENETDIVHVDSGVEISLISRSITIPQSNGTGHGIVKKVEDLCGYDFKLTKTAQKEIYE